jgi:hypothetical protein
MDVCLNHLLGQVDQQAFVLDHPGDAWRQLF